MSAEPRPASWLSTPERGVLLGVRFVFGLATLCGRGPARLFLRLLALYYLLVDRTVVRASRSWLGAVHGRPATRGMVYQHILRFAHVTLDRVYLLRGETGRFRITRTGVEHLERLVEQRRGAVLLGAHLGSYEAMRAGGALDEVPINILGYFENARMVNALFAQLNPDLAQRVIHIRPDSVGFVFEARQSVEDGEMIAVLGDRVGLNEQSVEVDFFGRPARFAAGPFLLASVLRCPVYLVFGLFFEPDRYELYCEPFAERVELPRARRQAALQELVQRYAQRLEAYGRKAPDNWFNFYDFWSAA